MSPSPLPPRTGRAIAALALMAGLLALAGCGRNVASFFLAPTGERPVPATGSVSGTLDFGTPGTYPQSLVLMARVRDPNCVSAYNNIKVVGTNTDPIFNVATAPALTQIAPCVWIDTLTLASARITGTFEWKFVTNNAFDNPPDYSTTDGGQIDGLENSLAFAAPGSANLDADVPPDYLDRTLVCVLDESVDPPTYAFKKIEESTATFSSTADGRFTISGLVPGTYRLRVRPPTGAPVNLTVDVGNANVELGTVQVGAPAGSISGELEFEPTLFPDLANPPWPPVRVVLLQGGIEMDEVTTTRTDKTFSFGNLPAGDYRVRADARLYAPDSADATVSAGNVDVGTLTLNADFNELASDMHVAGDFNNFTIADTTRMAFTAQLVWQYTPSHPIAAGTYNMKFVTDASFDNPTDYGGDESVTITVPVVNSPTGLVSGFGTAIKLQFTAAGNYRFTLDERRQTFSVESVPAPSFSAVRR